ncbi:MAG: AMP-binding protein [Acidimicrobiales bacterium]
MSSSTLPEVLAEAAQRGDGGWYFHLGREVVHLPVRQLYARALQRSLSLSESGVGPGTNVGLVGLNGPHWAEWAWATWLAGAALVPLPAPVVVGQSFGQRVADMASTAGCSVVIGKKSYLDMLSGQQLALWDWSATDVSDLPATKGPPGQPTEGAEAVLPESTAVLLYTSGSTSAPKCVRMSHARAVEWARHNALSSRDGAVPALVTWFPFYHVAGLGVLFEMLEPVEHHVLGIKRFLADPGAWLRLVSEVRASYAVSPSSVWAEVLDAVSKNPAGIDLSHLGEVAFNAELANPDVVARLEEDGGRLGLRPGTVTVHYASSEAGMITKTALGSRPRVDNVDLHELARSGAALPSRQGQPVKRVVSCGRPYPGAEVCLGSPRKPLPERRAGEVWVRGPGVADGYLNASNDNFGSGWLRLGDLAYMAEGELFVTGRSDEVVTCFGEKYHPDDIEGAVQRAIGLPPQKCVAFAGLDDRRESFVVVVEAQGQKDNVAALASAAVADAIGLAPSRVLVVPPGTIPTTPNGKLQRAKLRRLYVREQLSRDVTSL